MCVVAFKLGARQHNTWLSGLCPAQAHILTSIPKHKQSLEVLPVLSEELSENSRPTVALPVVSGYYASSAAFLAVWATIAATWSAIPLAVPIRLSVSEYPPCATSAFAFATTQYTEVPFSEEDGKNVVAVPLQGR